jgi:arsenite methyltransferase
MWRGSRPSRSPGCSSCRSARCCPSCIGAASLAIADIVTETELTPQIVANTDLWASCIGGAAHADAYQRAIAAAGLDLVTMRTNDYRFLSEQARAAGERFGVHSVSLLARKR